jgi:hypothetical protein
MAKLTRTYKRGVYEVYDDEYDRQIVKSYILNSGSNSYPSPAMVFLDKTNIQNEIYKLIGDQDEKV